MIIVIERCVEYLGIVRVVWKAFQSVCIAWGMFPVLTCRTPLLGPDLIFCLSLCDETLL